MTILLFWHDEAANRYLKYEVTYVIDGDLLQIMGIRPKTISFYDSQTQTACQPLPIESSHARKFLRERFVDAGMLESLVVRIADKHNLAVVS